MSSESESAAGKDIRVNGISYQVDNAKDSGPNAVSLDLTKHANGKKYTLPNLPKESLKDATNGKDLSLPENQAPQPVEEVPSSSASQAPGAPTPAQANTAGQAAPEAQADDTAPASPTQAESPTTPEATPVRDQSQVTPSASNANREGEPAPSTPVPPGGFQAPPPQASGQAPQPPTRRPTGPDAASPSPTRPASPASPLHTQPSPHKIDNLNKWRAGGGHKPGGPDLARRRPFQAPLGAAAKGAKKALGSIAPHDSKAQPKSAGAKILNKTEKAAEQITKKALKFTVTKVMEFIAWICGGEVVAIVAVLIVGVIIVFALAAAAMSQLNVFSQNQSEQVNYSTFKSQALQSGISEEEFKRFEHQAQQEFDKSQLKKTLPQNSSNECSEESCTAN